MRSHPLSIGSPGSCAQKCRSLICGRLRISSVSSRTAVSASHNRYAPAAMIWSRFSNRGVDSGGPKAPQETYSLSW